MGLSILIRIFVHSRTFIFLAFKDARNSKSRHDNKHRSKDFLRPKNFHKCIIFLLIGSNEAFCLHKIWIRSFLFGCSNVTLKLFLLNSIINWSDSCPNLPLILFNDRLQSFLNNKNLEKNIPILCRCNNFHYVFYGCTYDSQRVSLLKTGHLPFCFPLRLT